MRERRTGTGRPPSFDQIAERKRIGAGEMNGFDFVGEPNPSFWLFNRCTEHEWVGEEESCAGCAGWGMECWSVWEKVRY